MIGIIGFDKLHQGLKIDDICKFEIEGVSYEGIISYDEQKFAYIFEMIDDQFPAIMMHLCSNIERITNVWSTGINDSTYEKYRKLKRG